MVCGAIVYYYVHPRLTCSDACYCEHMRRLIKPRSKTMSEKAAAQKDSVGSLNR